MTNRFACSNVTQETIRFRVQIVDYSKYVCKGYYTSPKFDKEHDSKWSLLVYVYDGAVHENFIDVQLQRHGYADEMQFVNVKTSIVNSFGFGVLKNEKKILFRDLNETRILAVAKEQLKGYYGLKKDFFLPNDTLTLQCDLLVHERSVSAYQHERYLNNVPHYENSISEYFAQSLLVEKANDYFVRKITDFSVQSYGGRTIAPEFQSESLGGKWSLVVCNTTDYNNSSEYLDIRLMRQESYENQFVKVKLSIKDPLNNELLSKEKYVYFTSAREVQLLSSTETVISCWYGLRKKQLIPIDTLTLRCEIVLYEQNDSTFDRKEDFDRNVKNFGYTPMQRLWSHFLPALVLICFMLPVILHISYKICFDILPYILYRIWYRIYYYMVDIFETIKWFVFGVYFTAMFVFPYIIRQGKNIMRKRQARENQMELRGERHRRMLVNSHVYTTDNYGKRGSYYFQAKPRYSNHVNTHLYYNKIPTYTNRRYYY